MENPINAYVCLWLLKDKLIGIVKLWKKCIAYISIWVFISLVLQVLYFLSMHAFGTMNAISCSFHLLSFAINPLGTNCSVVPKCYMYGEILLGCYDLSRGKNGGFACLLVLFNWMSILHLHLILGLSLSAWHRSSCHRTAPQCSYLPYCNFYSLQKC